MRTSLTLLPLGLAVLMVGIAMVSPITADEIVTGTPTSLSSAAALWNGSNGPLFSTVKFHHGFARGFGWGFGGYPYYGGSYYGNPYSWNYGDGYGYYTRGNQVCVFSGYGYRCYTPGGSDYYY